MAKEGSVAPKERVNIKYSPATEGVDEDVELPMKSLVLGEFSTEPDPTPLPERRSISVDKDNFNSVLKGQHLNLSINVENELDENASEDEELAVSLKFDSLSDFSPDSIAEQVPELKQLIELREALKAVKSPLGNVPEFRKRLSSIISDPDTRKQLLDELNLEYSSDDKEDKADNQE